LRPKILYEVKPKICRNEEKSFVDQARGKIIIW